MTLHDKIRDLALLIILGALGVIGWRVYRERAPAVTHITTPAPGLQVVTVEKPVLTERTVRQVVKDPVDQALIAQLIAENAKLKADVKTVTTAQVESTSQGTGVITETPPLRDGTSPDYHFKDYRLTFDTDLKTARYTLDQRFEVVTSTGRQKNGSPLALTRLYEIGPKDTDRRELTTTKSTFLVADETAPHWLTHLAIQGGLGGTKESGPVGLVAAQWLKHGHTAAAEDVTYAILSPAVVFGNGIQDVGILPASVNLGRIPHQPFSNLWLSVFLSRSRIVPTVSASF